MEAEDPRQTVPMRRLEDLVFVAFNSRVAALDRENGELVWAWTSPDGTGFVALLLDGDRLIASVDGYTYCLDPLTGHLVWSNPLKGFGTGAPSLASVNGVSFHSGLGEAEGEEARRSEGS